MQSAQPATIGETTTQALSRLERIAPDWNREAIQGRVNPLGKILERVQSG
jgi:hypothetical protein